MKLPWHWQYQENGGYDSMTDAIVIIDRSGKTVAVLDLVHYGQEHCEPPTNEQRQRAEFNAQTICDRVNEAFIP